MLRISRLTKVFAGRSVLSGLEISLARGEVAAVTGPSGAGKTTLLHQIAGLDRPDQGQIFWGDRELAGPGAWIPPWRRPLSLVFQDLALWPHLTVAQHLDFVLDGKRGTKRRQRRAHRHRWLERLRIAELAKRYPAELSGGQQQRVALARSLVREPELLLLDEPFSQLDESLERQVWREIAEWRAGSGATILIVTHDTQWLTKTVDRCFHLRDGLVELLPDIAAADRRPVRSDTGEAPMRVVT